MKDKSDPFTGTAGLLAYPALTVALLFAPASALADDSAGTLVGIHVQLSGLAVQTAIKAQLDMASMTCEQANHLCSMSLPPKPDPVKAARFKTYCAGAGAYKLKGSPSDIGKIEKDVYYAPILKMERIHTKTTVLKSKSACEHEVVVEETIDITHFKPGGHTKYTMKDVPGKGKHWSVENGKLSWSAASALSKLFPLADPAKISPVKGSRFVAGNVCGVRETNQGGLSAELCMLPTKMPFPQEVNLAAKIVSGSETMLDIEATSVDLKAKLPISFFYPPSIVKSAPAKASKPSGSPASTENATQKWCLKQKIKTGVNPCEDESDDE